MHPTALPRPLADLSEKELQSQLFGTKVGAARQLGWLCFHTLRSKGSEPGFPDWTIVRDRVIFAELKTEKGTLSEPQTFWLRALLRAGAEAYVVRPRYLDAFAWVLAKRYQPRPGDNPHGDAMLKELASILGEQ